MLKALLPEIHAHATEAWPEASCGAVFGGGDSCTYHAVPEIADNSRGNFRVERSVLRRLEALHGPLRAVVHSHPAGEEVDLVLHTPSAAEMRSQLLLKVPFGVVVCSNGSHPLDTFWFGDQCPIQPHVGRPFRHGVMDCYSLCRDWYRTERQLVLREFPREWNWWIEAGQNMYTDGFAQAGFRSVERSEVKEGDAVLFRMRSKVPNHGAVIVEDGWMLHHPASLRPYDAMRMSHYQRLDRWERHATHWLRHESMF